MAITRGPKHYLVLQKKLLLEDRNCIAIIQNESAWWLFDNKAIKQHVVHFFLSLYTCEDSRDTYPLMGCFPIIDKIVFHTLQGLVDDTEIKNSIFSMKPLKASGVDGLHAIFYQSQWSIVDPSFCCFVKEIFSSGHIPEEINSTLLVMIPRMIILLILGCIVP